MLGDNLPPSNLIPWYSSSNSSEGIGEGWFYSVLGGGKSQRRVSLVDRVPVTFDNTLESRMRGDFAVPTLFNGNFEAVFNPDDGVRNTISKAIPGWSFHGGDSGSTGDLVEWSQISSVSEAYKEGVGYSLAEGNYALELEAGESITHNRFVVPDWGVLRFDLHIPVPAAPEDQNSFVKVFLGDEELKSFADPILPPDQLVEPNEQNNPNHPAVDLREVSELATDTELMQGQTNRIGYGTQGFQTFHVDIPEHLRGKVSTLRFEVAGNKTVYLDNVFFKSIHLNFGNPKLNGQEARQDTVGFSDNYLVEKPQYSLSYNDSLKTPNWVSYQLNKTWLGDSPRPERFAEDLSLPFPDHVKNKDIPPSSGYERGHMTANADRNRNRQDQYATWIMTNTLPQYVYKKDGGGDPWTKLENDLRKLVDRQNNPKELYITAGRDGESEKLISKDGTYEISVPSDIWKLVLVVDPGQ